MPQPAVPGTHVRQWDAENGDLSDLLLHDPVPSLFQPLFLLALSWTLTCSGPKSQFETGSFLQIRCVWS